MLDILDKITIGNIEIDNRVFLAPMAGITDIAFRSICKEFGVGLMHTEMISAKGLYYKDIKTEKLMKINKANRPISLQIFGSDADIMAYVVENYINSRDDIDIIDINMGCPAPKIVKNGDGSALMNNSKLAGNIINKIKKKSSKPLTVKIRAGWDEDSINAVEFSKNLEYNGADLITVHGRTRQQFYSGTADYNIIKMVKENVKIPVVGNGDIYKPEDAIKMLKQTNCDAIMIGRGILGNPWLIKNTINIMNNKDDFYDPSPKDKIDMLIKHANILLREMDEKIAILEMRKHVGWYIKGLKKSSEIRSKINVICTYNELNNILNNYMEDYYI